MSLHWKLRQKVLSRRRRERESKMTPRERSRERHLPPTSGGRAGLYWRVGSTVLSIVLQQTVVFAVALFPIAAVWTYAAPHLDGLPRVVAVSLLAAPSYVAFAVLLMIVSPLAARLTGSRTPEDAELPLADMSWPLMRWARYAAGNHLVRLVAGSLFRGSPLWSFYLRQNGARIGRRVYVNSLHTNDHNLLDLGDDVVIGGDVHISGHTVEGGVLKTGRVTLARGVTIGLHSVVGIGVDARAGAQVAALSVVPKYARLQAGCAYAGAPARPLPLRPGGRTDGDAAPTAAEPRSASLG
jgi:acetyltransferase-like isoleucine patch superfamily enzyme